MKTKNLINAVVTALLTLTFLFLAVGQLGRISFLGQQINGYIYEIPVFLITAYFILVHKLKPLKTAWKEYKSVFIFFGIVFVSYIFGLSGFDQESNAIAALYIGRLLLSFLFFFYLLFHLKKEKGSARIFFYGIIIFACITALFSIVQYVWYPELRNLLYLGWDPHLYRMFGTFLDTSIAAAIYSLCFFFIFFYGERFFQKTYLHRVFMGIFLICILLTFSRTTYIVFFAALLFLLIRSKQYLLSAAVVLGVIGILIVVPKPQGEGVNLLRTFSIESRFADYTTAAVVWARKPFLGYGYNRLRPVKKEFGLIDESSYEVTHAGASLHSSFLVLLVTTGIVGLGVFVWVLYELARKGKHTLFFVLFVSVLSLADNILLQPFVLFLFLCILSYDIAVTRLSDRLR